MSDLTDFLLARIAEDENRASGWSDDGPWGQHPGGGWWMDPDGHPIYAPRARVLAEAKRRIIESHPIYRGDRIQPIDTSGTDFGCELCHRLDALHSDSLIEAVGYCDTLLALASVYADHPDYREEWKP